ncbi:MAG: hypothetical protein AVDCRST_MAG62-637 [uncultured Sphingomonas sp.]|uniref:Uncharacterized protein n=1 Tax=uncultured Sphingomonas sp. TaxID=158754 RepID=A0A6J4T3F3_9SPHN|nr:MAG: hypothetical protein AVDCRST_MAG62-637 [uncultured Sphingomonas sp.]
MSNRDQNRRDNDALQSSENDAALSDDARAFGAGGQQSSGPLTSNQDAPNRDPERDPTLPETATAGGDQS